VPRETTRDSRSPDARARPRGGLWGHFPSLCTAAHRPRPIREPTRLAAEAKHARAEEEERATRGSAMPRIPAAERPRLTLEDYIVFFTTRGGTGLSLHQLNEVPTLSLVADQPVSVVPCACSELFFSCPPSPRRRSSTCTRSPGSTTFGRYTHLALHPPSSPPIKPSIIWVSEF
jgi:hypothetical protein